MKKIYLIILLVLLSSSIVLFKESSEKNPLKIIIFDIGQGDSSLILYNNLSLLIDCGPKNILPKLSEYNITTIDVLVITHFDKDHVNGCIPLINNFFIPKIFVNGETKKTLTFNKTMVSLIGKNVLIAKNQIFFSDIKLNVLNSGSGKNSNDNSIILFFSHGKNKFLFMADCDGKCEKNISVDTDFLRVGHHGSSKSCSKEFLERTSPSISVISTGWRGISNECLSRLKNPLRTDLLGDLIFESNGLNISLL